MENFSFPKSADVTPDKAPTRADRVTSTLHSTINKVTAPTRSAVDHASTMAHESIDRLTASAGHLADRIYEKTRHWPEESSKALDYSKSSVKHNPYEAVILSLLLGFIIGQLTATRHSSNDG